MQIVKFNYALNNSNPYNDLHFFDFQLFRINKKRPSFDSLFSMCYNYF